MDLHLLAPAFVYHEFRVHDHAPVVGPFAPDEVEDEEEGGEGYDAAAGRSYARIFDRFCEGV